MKSIMIIDGNNLARASHHAGNKLTVGGKETQAIFHFLGMLKTVVARFPNSKPIALWDGRAQWRYDLYPEYKANRVKTTPEDIASNNAFREQVPFIQTVTTAIGISQITPIKAEADDLARLLTDKAVEKGMFVHLVSADQDWLQLMSERCDWYDPIRKRNCTYDKLMDFTGYESKEAFIEGKAMAGDSSDNIIGVDGVGSGTASSLIAQYGSIEKLLSILDSGEIKKPGKRLQAIMAQRDRITRNLKLVDLRSYPNELMAERATVLGAFDEQVFKEFCQDHMFISILGNLEGYLGPFRRLAGK